MARVAAIEAESFATPWSEAAFASELDIPFSRAVVAHPIEDRANVVGYAVWWRVSDEVHLLDVAVAASWRRLGVGELLVRRVLDDARECAARMTTLEVAEDNRAGRALYERLGFSTVLTRKDYYGPGRSALVLERAIP
ncbi:ribosomal protein S18-alanine N-acetyltransferase [Candidatus Binatia bacterium]|nr:ribosomal protein S18-alanine N-acetyltransferase [Candidatus Binatia bacterium]